MPAPHPIRRLGAAPALAGALLLAGMSVPAIAQSPEAASPLGSLAETLGLKAKPTRAPDFVERSRPATDALHYIPVGTPHPDAAVKTMTPAEVAAATDALDQARVAQQRRAGLAPAPPPRKNPQATKR